MANYSDVIFIIGGSGFVGGHIVGHLNKLDYKVRVLVRRPPQGGFRCGGR